ncbi:MAG: hypothetical protein BRC55_00080 [Cyanobacteria bacterium SW_8_48_13]|nr:MAG: hypothetical protein BRC55_00080 [Cyanobacteria bacterium SW_8_48_13]
MFGWLSIWIVVKLWVWQLAHGTKLRLVNYGIPCLRHTVKARYALRASCLRQIAYTDFWEAYAAVLPSKRHRAVGKETGKTSYIEKDTGGDGVLKGLRKPQATPPQLLRHLELSVDSTIRSDNASLLV